jgi:hypothetical protein
MNWVDIDLHPRDRVLRQFAVAWLVIVGSLGVNHWLSRGNVRVGVVLLAVAMVVGTAGVLRPQAIRWIFVVASIAAFPVGWVVSQLMLLMIFAVVITPVALLFKIIGRDRLWRKRTPERKTYWKPKTPTHDVRRYLRQY